MAPLPRIACFHGGGSSAAIFAVQCEALQRQLASTFVFEFFEAPFERDAGPGVLPFFKYEKYGPYKTWFQRARDGAELSDGRSSSLVKSEFSAGVRGGEGGVERVWRLLRGRDAELELEGREGEMGEWVGVMGFSQGTRVVAGLLLDLQRRKEMGRFRAGDIDFKFGVLCMGSGPPMLSDLASVASDDSIILAPTLHLHGLRDGCYEGGKKQCHTYFEQSAATVYDIDYHHAMPWHRADLLRLAQGMRELWEGCL